MLGLVNVRDHVNEMVDSDWGPAFAAAIEAAVTTGRNGVFVPASAAPYTVRKPGQRRPSIDLRGLAGFTLAGEGSSSRIQLIGSGLNASWNMILIGGASVDVMICGLYLDGNKADLTDLDPGQHTHTIQIGGGSPDGSARRVRVLDCTMTDMDGDGVAIVAAGPFGGGRDVSVVDIVGCTFLNCHRSGVSNQRSVELVRINNCHFEGTRDQDIDFEPSGAVPATGPRRYSIVGNTFIHSSSAACVTLSGVSGDIPSDENIFAFNHVYGGRVGMVDARNLLFFGNIIESGLDHVEAVLQMRGTVDGVRISHNHIVRVADAAAGSVVNISSRAIDFAPKGFDHQASTMTLRSHGRETGDGPVQFTTTGSLPTGLSVATDYWLIRVDADTLRLATSAAQASAGSAVAFSDNGSGRASVLFPASTVRLDGFDHLSDLVTVKSHARTTGTGPAHLTTSGTLPTGLEPGTPYWLIRIDEDTLQLAASKADAVAGTAIAFSDDGVGDHHLIIIDRPRGVDVSQNRIHTYCAPDGERCTVYTRNAQECSIVDNEISSRWSGGDHSAVRLVTEGRLRDTSTGWNISGNRISGDAGGGHYDNGVIVAPTAAPVGGIMINDNAFRGCLNQVRWSGARDQYADIPLARGNTGAGTDFADLANVEVVCIAGNAGSQADYMYVADDEPGFVAADGSTARRRTGGGAGTTLYVREAGVWRGV